MSTSVPPPVSPLAAPGALVGGKFRIDTLIGYGGMGSVWAATHLGLGHQVAIKFISEAHAKTPEVRRRFDTEAKAVARLKSRHVVQVYDNGELDDGTPYIAMELLHGESLHRRIHRAGPMQLPEAVAVISQACRALTKAHAAGIVHRDIKPDNIFLANDEDGGIVTKVLDFGVAKLTLQEGEQSSTQTGSLVGTPLYMSPEQARGLKGVDLRTDLYSLALVAYTLLSGNLAFSGESFGDLLLKICTQPLPSLKQAAPWLPPAVDDWFQRAAAREPAGRFGSAQEMAEAFAVAAGVAVGSVGQGSVPDGKAPIRIIPAAPLGDSITKQYPRSGGGPAASPSTMTGATVQADGPPPSLQKKKGGPAVAVASVAGGVALVGVIAFVAFTRHAPATSSSTASSPPPLTAPVASPASTPSPVPPLVPVEPAPSAPAVASATPSAEPSAHAVKPSVPVMARPAAPPPRPAKPAANKPKSDTVDLGY